MHWKLAWVGVGLLSVLAACAREPAPVKTPPIVFISLDTLRADMLGLYGYDTYRVSPFLDSLAGEMVVFENAIAQSPHTLTSHTTLFTGLPPHEHRADEKHVLAPEIPTLAARLTESGYQTQAFADGGFLKAKWGLERGFEGYDEGDRLGLDSVLPKALAWLEDEAQAPFFLFLHSYDVHAVGWHPFYPSPEPYDGMFSAGIDSPLNVASRKEFVAAFLERKQRLDATDLRLVRARYAEGIRHVDDALRDFFERIRSFDWYDEALIVIWSDHGEGLFDHEDYSHGEVFDHTIRVPLLVRFPGGAHAGRRVESVVESADLAPTILELAGAEPLASARGRSLLQTLERVDEAREVFSARTTYDARRFSLRTLSHHYVWHPQEDAHWLFDLRDDPAERRNLVGQGLPEEKRLRDRLTAWVVDEHDRKRGQPLRSEEVRLDEATEEGLRALGYIE